MTRPTDLIPGNCYFDVTYHDADLLIPDVCTLIYESVEAIEEGQKSWTFRFADASPEDEVQLCSYSEDQLSHILDLPGLVKVLSELSRIGPYTTSSPPIAAWLSEGAAAHLRTNIAEFLGRSQSPYLCVSIKFVDQGFSIGRRDNGGLQMGFVPHPLQDDEDVRLLGLFQRRGTAPHVDYFAGKGRTRVLEFAVPSDLKGLESLSQQVLKDIFGIRTDDELKFTFGEPRG